MWKMHQIIVYLFTMRSRMQVERWIFGNQRGVDLLSKYEQCQWWNNLSETEKSLLQKYRDWNLPSNSDEMNQFLNQISKIAAKISRLAPNQYRIDYCGGSTWIMFLGRQTNYEEERVT